MKKKLLILLGMFVFFQFGFSLSCFFPYYKIEDGTIMYYGGSNKVMLEKFIYFFSNNLSIDQRKN